MTFRNILKFLAWATLFTVALGYLAVRYVLWPQLPAIKQRIESTLTQQIGRPLAIGSIETSWDRFMPSLSISQLTVGDPAAPTLSLAQVDATLSWRSLTSFDIKFASIAVRNPKIQIKRLSTGEFEVAGIRLPKDDQSKDRSGLRLLFEQRNIRITDGQLRWQDELAATPAIVANNVQLTLQNRGRSHQVAGRVGQVVTEKNGEVITKNLDIRGDFLRPVGSQSIDLERWGGDTYLALAKLQLPAIAEQVKPWLSGDKQHWLETFQAGTLDARTWIKFSETMLPQIQINASAAALRALAPNQIPLTQKRLIELSEVRISAAIERRRTGTAKVSGKLNEWSLTQVDLSATEPTGITIATAKPSDFVISDDGQIQLATIVLKPLQLEKVAQLTQRLPLPNWLHERIDATAIRGSVQQLGASWKAAQGTQAAVLDFSADFDQLFFRAGKASEGRLGLPGARGLTGSVRGGLNAGRLLLNSKNSSVTFPGLFEEEQLDLRDIKADLDWQLSDATDVASAAAPQSNRRKLAVNINKLDLTNADLTARITGKYYTGGKGPGLVDLKGGLDKGANLLKIYRYLPKFIGQPVRDWIKNSVRSGTIDQSSFEVKGDFFDFPFRPREDGSSTGVFKIASRLQGVTLSYNPKWPEITNANGDLLFDGPGMALNLRSGSIYDVKFAKTEATIKDFRAPLLMITGKGFGPGQDMVKFVNSSPLGTTINDFTAETLVQGDAALDLKLTLPIGDLGNTKVDGAINFANNDVQVDKTIPQFTGVNGQLSFSETGIALNNIVGTFLGGPIKVVATPSGAGRLTIKAEGRMDAVALRTLTDNALTQKLSGEARYTSEIDVRGRLATMRVESDLVGLSSDLPAPFKKLAADALPLLLQTVPNPIKVGKETSDGDLLNAQIGSDIKLAFERKRDEKTQKLQIFRGAFGVQADPVLPDAGFSVVIKTPRIDVDQWTPILATLRGVDETVMRGSGGATITVTENISQLTIGFAQGFSLLPSSVAAAATEVRIGGREIKEVVIGATRVEGFWRANMLASNSSGYFTWRDPKPGEKIGSLTARFNRLVIPKAQADQLESLLDSSPDQLPGLDIAAEEFIVDETSLGKIEFIAENDSAANIPSWSIKSLKIENPAATLTATGDWKSRAPSSARVTNLKFNLAIKDSGVLLNMFGIKKAIKDGPGKLSGDLAWNGSPLAIDFPTLTGKLELDLDKGQFLKVDPGVAKLISVFNLQSLPKRLTLDFGDVISEGFTFDDVKGSATIRAGIARTDSFNIKGVQAKVKIAGSADIAQETQELVVTVTPELNVGLASLAYVAVNPAIGLGSLAAQIAFRQPLQQLLTVEYDVKGSWVSPEVSERKRTQVLVTATPER